MPKTYLLPCRSQTTQPPSATVTADGSSDGGASSLTGYTIIAAADLDAATETAKGCPVLAAGGTVEVYETVEMG